MRSRIPGPVLVTIAIMLGLAAAVVALQRLPAREDTTADRQAISRAVPTASAPTSPTSDPTRKKPRKPRAQRTCVDTSTQRLLTVVTFNIHSARTHDGRVDLAAVAHALKTWDADIVLLQEVDRGRAWSRRIDMPASLAQQLGRYWTFGNNVQRSATNQYGTAILSRYPITSSTNTALPRPGDTQQRGLLHATIDVDGTELSVYDTHLQNASTTARAAQIAAITPILAADDGPTVFGGDLNAGPGSSVIAAARAVMTDSWAEVGTGSGATVPAANPRVRIDYLFHRNGSGVRLRPLQSAVLSSGISDHRAVWVRYQLTTAGDDVCLPVLDDTDLPGSGS